MARPIRSASLEARKLIAKGFNLKYVDQVGSMGMSKEEEDELNAEIYAQDITDLSEEQRRKICESEASSAVVNEDITFLTYTDEDVEPPIAKFQPTRVPGPHLVERITRSGVNQFTRAIDFFQLFLPDEFLKVIVENTNLYAWLNILDKPTYSIPNDGAWDPVCLQELKNYLAMTIFNGFAGRSDIERNWSQATLYSGGWSRRFLSKNRFKAISAMLHVSKPGEEDPNDKLAKMRPMIDQMQHACAALFHPRRALSVDERMVASKGRSPIKQYMPDKPTRFGFKLWCVCDPETGYTFNFNVYTGRGTKKSSHGLGYDVVMALVEPYKNHGHVVHCDNFFNSEHLAKDLLQAKTGLCGTMQHWRRGFPVVLKGKEWGKHAKHGDMRFVRQNGVLYLQWYDKKVVTMVSTMHRGTDHVLVFRKGKNKDGKYSPTVTRIPACVRSYNKLMGGVDLSDQLIEAYNCLVKVQRWWKTLFLHMLDLAIVNSFLLFRMWKASHPEILGLARYARYSHLDFREELVRQLANIRDDEMCPIYYPALKRKKSMDLSGPHDPQYTKVRRNCQVCYVLHGKQRKSYIRCADEQCCVHLCLNKRRNCFPVWHSKKFDKYRYNKGKEE